MLFRKIIQWMLTAIVVTASGNAIAASRGLELEYKASEAADAPVAGSVRLYDASYALVIGNDAYRNWPRLSNAVKDAELVAAELENQGFEVTLKRNLTSKQLKSVLEEFYIVKGADKNARLMVWYAGHGETVNGEGYLVPIDAPLNTTGTAFKRKALSLRRFGEYVRQAQAKHAMAVFDSCFAGTIFGSTRSKPPPAVTRSTGLPVRQFLTSGDAGETVSDDGTFRKLFIRALRGEEHADANGDGYLTGSELGNYLGDRVVNLQMGQTPRYGKLRDPDYDRGDFVFSLGGPDKKQKSVAVDKEALFWSTIKDSKRASDFEAYLNQYWNGTFTSLARIRLNELNGTRVSAVTTMPKVPVDIEEMDAKYIAIKTANLRLEPSTNSKIVGSLHKGKGVVVMGRVKGKNWYRLNDGSFVFGSLIKLVDPVEAEEQQAWELINGSKSASDFEAFLVKYPGGRYAAAAKSFVTYLQLANKVTALTIPPAPDAVTTVPKVKPPSPAKPGVGIYPQSYKPLDTFKDCGDCPEMVVIPAGSFRMGDLNNSGEAREKPIHHVTIPEVFAVGKFEVTQTQWKTLMGSNPSHFNGSNKPVEQVSWDDAQEYIVKLNKRLGLSDRSDRYRLLSEAEWEYVARAGTNTKYHFGNSISKSQANYGGNSTVDVGQYPANGFGLHDVHGNVWEWTEDCLNNGYTGAPNNGSAWASNNCAARVIRSGSWFNNPGYVRSANRNWYFWNIRTPKNGFRVARTLSR
jgi:formylglycine-generating enzyme required for sulfatase activity